MSKKEKKMNNVVTDTTELNIPEDEIYTYQVEGLAAPHINKPYKNYKLKKVLFVLVIVVAVSLSMFFSLNILTSDTFTFAEISDGNYQFTKFSNPGYVTELKINYALELTYPENKMAENKVELIKDAPESLPAVPVTTADEFFSYQKYNKNEELKALAQAESKTPYFEIVEDRSKPVTSIKEFAINGDGNIRTIYIGENVLEIDGKAFYSCWALQRIIVDENNPNYCDIDGVLYTKDKKTVVCYPCDRDAYLRDKLSYPYELYEGVPTDSTGNKIISEEAYKEIFEQYKKDVMTYVIPSTVETVGEFCFNYSNLATVYLPEGLKKIDNLGFFEMPNMADFYTYVTDVAIEETVYPAVEDLSSYVSLPDGLEYIGTDAFSFNKNMTYVYIPSSVKFIGHHAFWDTAYSADGGIAGLKDIHTELTKDEFKKSVDTGDEWIPVYNSNLLKRVPVEYGTARR